MNTTDSIATSYRQFGINAPVDADETYTNDDYIEIGEYIAYQVDELRDHNIEWEVTNFGNDTNMIYSRANQLPNVKNNVLMLVTELAAPAWVIERLIVPWHKYRQHWDELLVDATILARLPQETYVIHHLMKKRITLSLRESIDLMQVQRIENRVIIGVCGTSHPSTPASRNYMRTHQYIGGFVIEPVTDNTTKLNFIYNADMDIPGPKAATQNTNRYSAKWILDFARLLRQGIKKYKDEIMSETKN